MRVAFIGLGVMGFPMAGHLSRAGHDVTVFNRTPDKADRWVSLHGGKRADTPSAAADGADIVFLCVGADRDVLEVVMGPNGVLEALGYGAVLVDHSTVSAKTANTIHHESVMRGAGCLDAPVSGGEAGAIDGKLTIMCGGDQHPYDLAEPAMRAYGRKIRLLGSSGSGQQAKMANQICIAGVLQGLSEALHLIEATGLDGPAVIDVIQEGAAGSWQMSNRAKTMLAGDYDFGFAVDWMRKDLAIVLAEAERHGLSLPLTKMVDQYYADVQALGGGRQDTSSLYRRLKEGTE